MSLLRRILRFIFGPDDNAHLAPVCRMTGLTPDEQAARDSARARDRWR